MVRLDYARSANGLEISSKETLSLKATNIPLWEAQAWVWDRSAIGNLPPNGGGEITPVTSRSRNSAFPSGSPEYILPDAKVFKFRPNRQLKWVLLVCYRYCLLTTDLPRDLRTSDSVNVRIADITGQS